MSAHAVHVAGFMVQMVTIVIVSAWLFLSERLLVPRRMAAAILILTAGCFIGDYLRRIT